MIYLLVLVLVVMPLDDEISGRPHLHQTDKVYAIKDISRWEIIKKI